MAHEPLTEQEENLGAIYFAGDTAKLDDVDLQAIGRTFQIAYNLQPSGPNFPRKYMQGTHQSTVDAIRTHFFFKKINQELKRKDNIKTLFMHHQTYHLGSDKLEETQRIKTVMKKMMEKFEYNTQDLYYSYAEWIKKEKSYAELIDLLGQDTYDDRNILNPKIGETIEIF